MKRVLVNEDMSKRVKMWETENNMIEVKMYTTGLNYRMETFDFEDSEKALELFSKWSGEILEKARGI